MFGCGKRDLKEGAPNAMTTLLSIRYYSMHFVFACGTLFKTSIEMSRAILLGQVGWCTQLLISY